MMSIFGAEFEQIWPKAGANLQFTGFGKKLLANCRKLEKPLLDSVNINEFIKKSSDFPVEFGTNTCRVVSQPSDRYPIIQKQIASAYPVIHERVLGLYLAFLEHKCKHGNKIEMAIYQNMTLGEFIQRLLSKRCPTFMGKNDKYLLLSRIRGCSGFKEVGTEQETSPLILANVLSYDEIKLAALLSISSHSDFINNGTRRNCGIVERNLESIERAGIVVSIIGARLNRLDVMEYQDIIISKTQNTIENGYGIDNNEGGDGVWNRAQDYRRIWREFYEQSDFLYDSVHKDGKRFGDSKTKANIFDNVIMKRRYTISFDTLLLEAEARARAANQMAFIHIVGIGLGVWRAAVHQEKIFLETFEQRLLVLMPQLNNIAVVHFSWFELNEWAGLQNGILLESPTHPNGGIRVFLSKRNPADKLNLNQPELDNMLLVVSYAADGNALPGNEFWMKMLKSTSDSATACSTLITELHNPHINTDFVCGDNLHIASVNYGVIHLADYIEKILSE